MSGDDDFMGNLLKQAAAMQEQMAAAQANAAAQEVEGQAGGGRVRITVTGGMEFRAVRIDPTVVDPTTSRCSRTSCSPRCTTQSNERSSCRARRSAASRASTTSAGLGGLLRR